MNLKRFNAELRNLLGSLISDGFLQKDVSALTFGLNRQDQLRSFLEGRDISGKPLQRIFDNLGFEIHFVPISKKEPTEIERIEEMSCNSIEALRLIFLNCLDKMDRTRKKKLNIVEYVDFIINTINKRK